MISISSQPSPFIPFISFVRLSRSTAENFNYQIWSGRLSLLAGLLFVVGLCLQFTVLTQPFEGGAGSIQVPKLSASAIGVTSPDCHLAVSSGECFY